MGSSGVERRAGEGASGGEWQPGSSDGRPRPLSRDQGVVSPLEAHSSYRGADWSPERLAFHQNLESFAERVGLIVALQSNGKLSQEKAYAEIRKLWKSLRASKGSLLKESDEGGPA